jgi:hypothetical protein
MKRHKTIVLLTSLVLIPVLFGLMPLNFMHRLASGVPLSPVKQVIKCNPCPFHSLTSHPEPLQIESSSVPMEPRPLVLSISLNAGRDVIPSGPLPDPSPLRC